MLCSPFQLLLQHHASGTLWFVDCCALFFLLHTLVHSFVNAVYLASSTVFLEAPKICKSRPPTWQSLWWRSLPSHRTPPGLEF